MKPETQLPLPFAVRTGSGCEDFLVTEANRAAFRWIEAWPAWPSRALLVTGPAGAGKTHLARVWADRVDARWIVGGALDLDEAGRQTEAVAALVVDGADVAPHRPLLHLHNVTLERQGWLLLTAREPPARWRIPLADLSSRLLAIPTACIGLPDDALVDSLVLKLAADRQLAIGPDVVAFLARRLERSYAAIGRLVEALDRASLARRQPITVALARQVLEALQPSAAGSGADEIDQGE